jgi:transcriptional regulator with XRE-family HTH domain
MAPFDSAEALARRIVFLRRETLGISQEELADRMNTLAKRLNKHDETLVWTKREIGFIENPRGAGARNRRLLRIDEPYLLATALDVTQAELLMGIGTPGDDVRITVGAATATASTGSPGTPRS